MALYDDLINAGIPVLSASLETGIFIQPGATLTYDQTITMGEIVMQYSDPSAYQIYLQNKAISQAIKDEYLNMIARLDQIQAATNPTNAQVIQAVKDEALYIERLMKVIKNIVT